MITIFQYLDRWYALCNTNQYDICWKTRLLRFQRNIIVVLSVLVCYALSTCKYTPTFRKTVLSPALRSNTEYLKQLCEVLFYTSHSIRSTSSRKKDQSNNAVCNNPENHKQRVMSVLSEWNAEVLTLVSRRQEKKAPDHPFAMQYQRRKCCLFKVVQLWPGLFVCKQVTVCPGHI
jgi:hypothetical protein